MILLQITESHSFVLCVLLERVLTVYSVFQIQVGHAVDDLQDWKAEDVHPSDDRIELKYGNVIY